MSQSKRERVAEAAARSTAAAEGAALGVTAGTMMLGTILAKQEAQAAHAAAQAHDAQHQELQQQRTATAEAQSQPHGEAALVSETPTPVPVNTDQNIHAASAPTMSAHVSNPDVGEVRVEGQASMAMYGSSGLNSGTDSAPTAASSSATMTGNIDGAARVTQADQGGRLDGFESHLDTTMHQLQSTVNDLGASLQSSAQALDLGLDRIGESLDQGMARLGETTSDLAATLDAIQPAAALDGLGDAIGRYVNGAVASIADGLNVATAMPAALPGLAALPNFEDGDFGTASLEDGGFVTDPGAPIQLGFIGQSYIDGLDPHDLASNTLNAPHHGLV